MSARPPSQAGTYFFVIVLCALCGFSLATISSLLKETQEKALILDQSKQMLMAAKIMDSKGFFIKKDAQDNYLPAIYNESRAKLEFSDTSQSASPDHINTLYENRLLPKLVNEAGKVFSFSEANLELNSYIQDHQNSGYSQLEYRLLYEILTEDLKQVEGYLIPVNGFGLWGPIYGYLAIGKDGLHIKGISWYKHKETPGLGAGISEAWWQKQFKGKRIFQAPNSGEAMNFDQAPLGINVVRGKVIDVYGEGPKSKNSVDGMSGATITGNGVTQAYKNSLSGYRKFLVQIAEQHQNLEGDPNGK